ncbi:MAG: O-antigen ligase family protein [Moorea sp. SIO3G5]|nr:O-antigen ligase family protein [Moorena sp. SIO3G5]
MVNLKRLSPNQLITFFLLKLEPFMIGICLFSGMFLDIPGSLLTLLKLASYLILVFLLIWRWKRVAYVFTKDIPLLCLVGTAVWSIAWSAIPGIPALLRAVLRATALGAYLAARYNPKEQMRLLAWVLGIVAILSLLVTLGNGFGGAPAQGILRHKNHLARLMSLNAIICLLTALNHWKYRWLGWAGFSLSVLMLLLSQGKSALVIFLVMITLLPLQKLVKQHYKLQTFLYMVSALMAFVGSILILGNLEFIVVDTLGKDLEFNGRLPIWTLVVERILERPWLGYGFEGFWSSDAGYSVINSTWLAHGGYGHSHSGYLELALQLGFLGVLLFVLSFLTALFRIIKLLSLSKKNEFFWMFLYLVFFSIANFSLEPSILVEDILWTLYVSTALSAAVYQSRIVKNRHLMTAAQV